MKQKSMQGNRNLYFLIALFLLIVVVFILYYAWPFITGKTFVLATTPIDPYDPFRGQYLKIRYEISSLTSQEFSEGEKIYVSLEEDSQGVWRETGVSKSKPSGDFIRGKVSDVSGDRVFVIYGLEQFFFERGAEVPTENITVEIKVTSSGRAALSQLLQNGEQVKINYLSEESD